MKMYEKKLKKFAVYSKIANVLFISVVVFGLLLVVVTIGLAINLSGSVNFISRISQQISNYIVDGGITQLQSAIFINITAKLLAIALTAYTIKSIALILRSVSKYQTPFSLKASRLVKNIGFAFIIFEATIFVFGIITRYVFIATSDSVVSVTITGNGSSLLIGLVILLIGDIFEFGIGLQQDSESIV